MENINRDVFLLKEYEILANLIETKSEQRKNLLLIILGILSVGVGYAVQYNLLSFVMFIPFFTIPIFFMYTFLYVEENVIRKYIKDKIEKNNNYHGWENYWFGVEFVKKNNENEVSKERENVQDTCWYYPRFFTWWIVLISIIPAFIYCIVHWLAFFRVLSDPSSLNYWKDLGFDPSSPLYSIYGVIYFIIILIYSLFVIVARAEFNYLWDVIFPHDGWNGKDLVKRILYRKIF